MTDALRVRNFWRVRIARAARDLEVTPQQLLLIWRHPSPHFRGEVPEPFADKSPAEARSDGQDHRYDGGDACVYCARPKDFPGGDIADDDEEPS